MAGMITWARAAADYGYKRSGPKVGSEQTYTHPAGHVLIVDTEEQTARHHPAGPATTGTLFHSTSELYNYFREKFHRAETDVCPPCPVTPGVGAGVTEVARGQLREAIVAVDNVRNLLFTLQGATGSDKLDEAVRNVRYLLTQASSKLEGMASWR